jgi:hypothetical protein
MNDLQSKVAAADLWTAYREGAFRDSPRPWLGYFMLLEEAPRSVTPVAVSEPHFPVFAEFRDASYAKRYELFASSWFESGFMIQPAFFCLTK